MRLLAARHREGVLDYRVISLRGPRTEVDVRQLCEIVGERLIYFNGHRGAFSHQRTVADERFSQSLAGMPVK